MTTVQAGHDWRPTLIRLLHGDQDEMANLASDSYAALTAAAEQEGVLFLLHLTLGEHAAPGGGAAWRGEVQLRVAREQAVELLRGAELERLTRAFADHDVRSLLFKGAALAYTHYPHAHLRTRCDTDLLVHPDDRRRAFAVLQSLEYDAAVMVEREAVFTQRTFYRRSREGVLHAVDLHWRISNRTLFRSLLAFDELYDESRTITALAPAAHTFSPVHALLLAAIHPVAHHRCDWPLIWLKDIALLAERFDEAEWLRFRTLAASRRVSVACKRALLAAADCFDGGRWLERSRMAEIPDARATDEPSAEYLQEGLDARGDLALDLKATRGLAAKSRLLLSHVFPDPAYIRSAYGADDALSVGAAYARRIGNAFRQLSETRASAER